MGSKAMEWFNRHKKFPLGVYGFEGEIDAAAMSQGGVFQARVKAGLRGDGWKTLWGPDFDVVKKKVMVAQKGYGGQMKIEKHGIILG